MIRPPAMPEPVRVERVPEARPDVTTTIEIGPVRIEANRYSWQTSWTPRVRVGHRQIIECCERISEESALDNAKRDLVELYDALTPAVAAIRATSGAPAEPTVEQLRDRLLLLSERAQKLVASLELEAEDLEGRQHPRPHELLRDCAHEVAALFTDPQPAGAA